MKRLVICCDGTWSTADQRSATNVTRLHRLVAPRDEAGVEQRSTYLPGVGTRAFERWSGGLLGFGLSQNVMAAYRWIVEHYDPGDEIYAFGYSRGAFTARSAVGLIRQAGVLRREHADRLEEAFELYRRDDVRPGDRASVDFRREHSHESRVRCVGVWDTVGALGVPSSVPLLSRINRRWEFHDTRLSSWVDAAFHAVAIDERRAAYTPTLWDPRVDVPGQRVEQVWFSGAHSDVGGGRDHRELAELTLWWMARRAASCGLALTGGTGQRDPAWSLGTVRDSRTGLHRLVPADDRPIARRDPDSEAVAESAVERRDADASYRPPELERHLDRGGRVATL